MKKLLLLPLLLLVMTLLNAQQKSDSDFDLVTFKADRVEYFTKELKLTDNQAKQFIPLMNEFMSKKFQTNKEARSKARQIRQHGATIDAEYREATEAFLNAKLKEAELQMEYFKKFESLLTAKQIYDFPRIEMDFMKIYLNDHGSRYRKNKK